MILNILKEILNILSLCLSTLFLLLRPCQINFCCFFFFWALRSFGLYLFLWTKVSNFRKFGSTLKLWEFLIFSYLEGVYIYLYYTYIQFTEYLEEQSFLLTLRNEQFEKQQSRPQRKAVSAGKSVLWRRLQVSQPQSRPIQKVRVWKENNHKYFSGLKLFLTSVSFIS